MSFDEHAALQVTAVRAVETSAVPATLWRDDDREWASRTAAEWVGDAADGDGFLAARARFALERLAERSKPLARALAALRWRGWVAGAIIVAAFVAGIALDQVGAGQRINLLAPPLVGVVAWNLAVYLLLVTAPFFVRMGGSPTGPVRRLMQWLGTRGARPGRSDVSPAIARLAADWPPVAAPLYTARASRILHLAAAALAVGLLAGLYLRGLAFEYRATWESTFLDAESVHAMLATLLAPGAALTRIPVPSLTEVAAIHAPAGENAARWLHLVAASVTIIVVLPRLLLAIGYGLLERRRAANMPVATDAPYFARLLRGYRGGPQRVIVLPYSYTLGAPAAATLELLLRKVFGTNVALTIRAPVEWGGDTLPDLAGADAGTTIVALFNATATPEPEAQGAFLAALAAAAPAESARVALIDDGPLRERWGPDLARLATRRDAWRALCAERATPCAVVMLAAADDDRDDAAAARALEAALAGPAP